MVPIADNINMINTPYFVDPNTTRSSLVALDNILNRIEGVLGGFSDSNSHQENTFSSSSSSSSDVFLEPSPINTRDMRVERSEVGRSHSGSLPYFVGRSIPRMLYCIRSIKIAFSGSMFHDVQFKSRECTIGP